MRASGGRGVNTKISVVVPVFRSAATLPELFRRLSATLETITQQWEIILVDDASNDGTFRVMQDLHCTEERVRIVRFARNMGQHHATLCGLQRARGEYVITLDDDLQNPPEEIPRFLAKVDEGYALVIGEITGDKRHGNSRNLASRLVQRLVGRILGKPRDLYLSSYRCMTRATARSLGEFTGAHVYLPALMLSSVPTELICNIPVEHHPRHQGRSQYTLAKLVKLTSYLLINHSFLPLRFVSAWGLLLSLASFGYAIYIAVITLFFGTVVSGFPTLALLVSFLSGNILFCMGILGEYIGRLVEENSRPRQFPVFEEEG
jgi:polyisoprenyl-phosphate glycosyltransferase